MRDEVDEDDLLLVRCLKVLGELLNLLALLYLYLEGAYEYVSKNREEHESSADYPSDEGYILNEEYARYGDP